MPEKGAAILGIGMITAVGLNAAQTSASVRAGITRFSETSIYDKRFEPFVMALLPDDVLPPLEPELEEIAGLTARQARLLRLAAPALNEVLENNQVQADVPLYLGVPEAFPNRPDPVHAQFNEPLATQSGVRFNVSASKIYPKGRAAALYALQEAIEDIESEKYEYVLAGGVDTYLDLYLLGTLDMEERILGPAVMDGFIPGEAAAFLLLTGTENAKAKNLTSMASLSRVGMGFEEGHLYSEEPYSGDGLAAAFEQLFQENKEKKPISEVFVSMNGENHWAKEWGVAFIRNQSSFVENHGNHHPSDCFGDIGAASGTVMLSIAAIGMQRGYLNSPALVSCSSDFGERAAVIVSST